MDTKLFAFVVNYLKK